MTENTKAAGAARSRAEEAEAVPAPPKLDPAFLERVYTRRTREGADALGSGEIVPRRRVRFIVDAGDCAPGVFVDDAGELVDFELTLEAPSAIQEVSITEGVKDPAEVVMRLACASMAELNGAPVVGAQRDFLWEALGPGGRQIVVTMYNEVGSASPSGLGKAKSSASRG